MAKSALSLHEIHCLRNFTKCSCGEVIKKSESEAHMQAKHRHVTCPQCSASLEAFLMPTHQCAKPLKACEFCEAQIRFDDFPEHVKQCGSRTQQCQLCKAFIPLRDYQRHVAAGDCLPPLPSYPSVPRRPDPPSNSSIWPPMNADSSSGEMGDRYYPSVYGALPVAVQTAVGQPYSSREGGQGTGLFSGPNVRGPFRLDDEPAAVPDASAFNIDDEDDSMLKAAIAMSLSQPAINPPQPPKPSLSQEEQDRLYAERLEAMGSLASAPYSSQSSGDLDAALAASLAYDSSIPRAPAGYLSYPGVGGGVSAQRGHVSSSISAPQGREPLPLDDENDEELQRAIRESMRDS